MPLRIATTSGVAAAVILLLALASTAEAETHACKQSDKLAPVAWTVVDDEQAQAFHVGNGLWITVLHGIQEASYGKVVLFQGSRRCDCRAVAQAETWDAAVLYCPDTREHAHALTLTAEQPGRFARLATAFLPSPNANAVVTNSVGPLQEEQQLKVGNNICQFANKVLLSSTVPARGQSGSPVAILDSQIGSRTHQDESMGTERIGSVIGMWSARSSGPEPKGIMVPATALRALVEPLLQADDSALAAIWTDFELGHQRLHTSDKCKRLVETPALTEEDERSCFLRAVAGGLEAAPGCRLDEELVHRGRRLQALVDAIQFGLAGPEALLIVADSLFESCFETSCSPPLSSRLADLRSDLRTQTDYAPRISIYQSTITKDLLLAGAAAIRRFANDHQLEQVDEVLGRQPAPINLFALLRLSQKMQRSRLSPSEKKMLSEFARAFVIQEIGDRNWQTLNPSDPKDLELLHKLIVTAIFDMAVSQSPQWLLCGMAAGAAELGWNHAGSSAATWRECMGEGAPRPPVSWELIVEDSADILLTVRDRNGPCYHGSRQNVRDITWFDMMSDLPFQIAYYVALDKRNVLDMRLVYEWIGRELAKLRGAELGLDGLARLVGELEVAKSGAFIDSQQHRAVDELKSLLPSIFSDRGITEAGFAAHNLCKAARATGHWRTHDVFTKALKPIRDHVCALYVDLQRDVKSSGYEYDAPPKPAFCVLEQPHR